MASALLKERLRKPFNPKLHLLEVVAQYENLRRAFREPSDDDRREAQQQARALAKAALRLSTRLRQERTVS